MSWRARLSVNVKEFRIHFCPNADSSAGVRRYFAKNYAELKTLNPGLPFLMREREGHDPIIIATYSKLISLRSVHFRG